ncbi:hypothetical protein GXM_04549 [Nostoc sphaeroides CCNUC1]|uniref:Uncharacterized protein n=1 Tax=Nostoc sphaeroides CCNUC1 TaxID=2653204 RepID=A0A5P8W2W1_9NOSO|nr:hypothetical protein GXM_04549 [Nostoc sphaeroides CCNUC1]
MDFRFILAFEFAFSQTPLDFIFQYRSVKPKNLARDAKFRVSTGLKSVPKILN